MITVLQALLSTPFVLFLIGLAIGAVIVALFPDKRD